MQLKRIESPIPAGVSIFGGFIGIISSFFIAIGTENYLFLIIMAICLYLIPGGFRQSPMDWTYLYYPSLGSSTERKLKKIENAIDVSFRSMQELDKEDPYYTYFKERLTELTEAKKIIKQEFKNKDLAKAAKYTSKVIRKELR